MRERKDMPPLNIVLIGRAGHLKPCVTRLIQGRVVARTTSSR